VNIRAVNIKSRKFIITALVILVAVALLLAVISTPPTEWSRAQRLGDYLDSLGVAGVAVFLLFCALATALGLPRQFFAFSAGFAYGVFSGVVFSSLGAIVGCAITFMCSRRLLSHRVKARYPDAINTMNRLLREDVFLKILALRLQPFGTNFITNVSAGVTHISTVQFLVSSWLGYLPQMLVFSLLGAGVRIGSNAYLVFSLSMLCLSLAIGYWLYRKTIRQNI